MSGISGKRTFSDERGDSNDTVLSLQDIINEDSELETMANAVLGGSNDQACTYSDGYVKRQALYACATCKTDGEAGICLACSLECHDGHELYELYTKRNFRCDCGNAKFPALTCSLQPNKMPTNDKNNYNHNFRGCYCTCERPYPDPDDDVDDEMIQCVVCEDWFHSRHLQGKFPEGSAFAEMICHLCMKTKASFLWYFYWEHEACPTLIDVCGNDDYKREILPGSTVVGTSSSTVGGSGAQSQSAVRDIVDLTLGHENATKKSEPPTVRSDSSSQVKSLPCGGTGVGNDVNPSCCFFALKTKFKFREFPDVATFWSDNWRSNLCKCSECKLKLTEINFLYKADDTVAEYEKRGADKYTEPFVVSGMRALSGMDRIKQVEVIQGYNDMKNRLSEFLRMFAEQGKVVTEEDIKSFFQKMSETKRPKLEMAYFCK